MRAILGTPVDVRDIQPCSGVKNSMICSLTEVPELKCTCSCACSRVMHKACALVSDDNLPVCRNCLTDHSRKGSSLHIKSLPLFHLSKSVCWQCFFCQSADSPVFFRCILTAAIHFVGNLMHNFFLTESLKLRTGLSSSNIIFSTF